MIRTFKRGGIHPPENKISAQSALEVFPPQAAVRIFTSQHLGAPAEPVVAKGDKVKVGQLIAKASGFVSANVHSSVSGTVTAIEPVADHLGFKKTAICIQVEGDEWESDIDRSADVAGDIKSTPEEILKRIADAGIVGLGGATFPTHVKLSIPPGKKAEALIVNAAECEPYLTSDFRVMMEYGEQLLIGVELIRRALKVEKAYIGIETNKQKAIDHLKTFSKWLSQVEIVSLKPKYPQGGEKQLIKAITGKEVPINGLPIDTGYVVTNVGTVYAVYEAVQKNKPLVESSITVTGKNLNTQKNYLVRIGTSVAELVNAVGGIPEGTGKVISGGPMMGKPIANLDAPTLKGTSAILFMPDKDSNRGDLSNCIRCSKCVAACPMGLEPYLLIRLAERKMYDELEANYAHNCIECGCCLFTCPARLPLVDYIRLGKAEVLKIMRTRK